MKTSALKNRMKVLKGERLRRLHSLQLKAPKGLYATTKEYLISRYGRERFRRYYMEYYTQDITHLSESKGLDQTAPRHFGSGIFHVRPVFTALLENARVWEKNGAVITPENRLLSDISWDYRGGLVHGKSHNVFRAWKQYPLRRLQGTSALLTFIWSGNTFIGCLTYCPVST